jgi:flagellar protein FlaG
MKVNTAFSNSVNSPPNVGGQMPAQTTSAEMDSSISNSVASKAVSLEVATNTQAPSQGRIAKAVEQVNDAFMKNRQELFVSIERDKATGIKVVKVVDKNTKELISQFPEKAVIAMAAAIGESLDSKGQLIDVQA